MRWRSTSYITLPEFFFLCQICSALRFGTGKSLCKKDALRPSEPSFPHFFPSPNPPKPIRPQVERAAPTAAKASWPAGASTPQARLGGLGWGELSTNTEMVWGRTNEVKGKLRSRWNQEVDRLILTRAPTRVSSYLGSPSFHTTAREDPSKWRLNLPQTTGGLGSDTQER